MKKIVLTGGGTGGHIIPNIALIPHLKQHFEIFYLGNSESMEEKLISKISGVKFVPINSVKFIRKFTLKNLLIPFKLARYIGEAKKILKEIQPNIIFAKGGYVSLPVVFAGKKLNIPILGHESDFSMGLANKLILKKCELMFTSFRETCVGDKCVYSGSPVRDEIFNGNKEVAEKNCGFKTKQPVVMIFGGSLGSNNINQFVFNNLDKMEKYNIIHIVGKGNSKNILADNYFQIEYAENIYDYFSLADIVICRAGSNSIFELLALNKPMLLIPLSKAQSRGDQLENANIFKKNGYALILEDDKLSIEGLQNKIDNILKNKNYFIKNMKSAQKSTANKIIIEKIIDYSL